MEGAINTGMVGGHNINMQGEGHTVNNNPNDTANLIEMVKDKDYIIAKLRKVIEEQQKHCSDLIAEKDRSIMKLIEDRDAIIKKMMDREQDLVNNSYQRNAENLARMDTMHEKMFELHSALLALLNK